MNNLFAINMYTVVYILCQKANPYMHVQYAYALYTYIPVFNNIIFTHQLNFSESR